ncbi:unnamed protein product [Cylicocyclus nassatus]|uniref:UPAR/Ly6 domain-containing protein n=1 Tax=Cylicocyclus nassatus TaxID=53992 RepID=A0AA36GR47_CYLNA|nr:unnamed protein product [Cylicocyclus nassatus]
MAALRIVLFFVCHSSLVIAIKCYLGDQLFQGSVLLRESVSLTDCPASRFCVRQDVVSADLKTVNFLCDQSYDVRGLVFIVCQGPGTHISTTPAQVPAINTCCAADLCNLYVSSSSFVSFYYIALLLLCKFMF